MKKFIKACKRSFRSSHEGRSTGVRYGGGGRVDGNPWDGDLRGDDLRGDDLRGDDLRGDDLRGDDLRGDDLRGDDPWGYDPVGDDLRGDHLRGFRRITPPQGYSLLMNKTFLTVFRPNGDFTVVPIRDATDVREIISLVTSEWGVGTGPYRHLYAMLLWHQQYRESYWLHPDSAIHQVQEKYEKRHPYYEWRYGLRIRYLPQNLDDLYEMDRASFWYYYDQVWYDYLCANHDTLDQDVAVQLCCIQIRNFYKDIPYSAFDKKSNFMYLEKEVGMHTFLPQSVLDEMAPKELRKLIRQRFNNIFVLTKRECRYKFFDLMRQHYRFDEETFSCAVGSNWPIPVELVIGPDLGISYMAHRGGTEPTRMAEFAQIQSVKTVVSDCGDHAKARIEVRLAGVTETLNITCSSLDQAESLADLIDGYRRLVTGAL